MESEKRYVRRERHLDGKCAVGCDAVQKGMVASLRVETLPTILQETGSESLYDFRPE